MVFLHLEIQVHSLLLQNLLYQYSKVDYLNKLLVLRDILLSKNYKNFCNQFPGLFGF